jgi:hypothetical protein
MQKRHQLLVMMLIISTFAQAQWTKANLSEARGQLGAAYLNGKVLIFGGVNKNTFSESATLDIYDPTTQKWSVSEMPNPRYDMSSHGNAGKLYTYGKGFSDRNKVNVFDLATQTWSQLTVQAAANSTETKIKGIGGKLYVNYDQIVHEFDIATETNTPLNNAGASRRETTFEVAGTKLMVAGGISGNTVSKDIDVYDTTTKSWSKTTLSEARRSVQTLVHQNKVYFVGGGIDNGYKYAETIDVYDIASDKWSIITMPDKRIGFAVAALGDNLFVAGGYTEAQDLSDKVNIYNLKTATWTEAKLSKAKTSLAAISDGTRVYFAGGNAGSSSSFDDVDIFTTTTGLIPTLALGLTLKVYPNPCANNLQMELGNHNYPSFSLRINDILGREVWQQNINANENWIDFDTSQLQQGLYTLTLSNKAGLQTTTFYKQ